MRRYFDLPDLKNTLLIEVKAGSAAALAEPVKIRDHFKQKGNIREIDRDEYVRLTRIYNGHKLPEEVSCNECEFTENEGGEGFRYCDNADSQHYGDCVEDASPECKCFKQK